MGIRICKKYFIGYPDLKILNGDGFFYPDTIRIQTLQKEIPYIDIIRNEFIYQLILSKENPVFLFFIY